MTTAKEQNASGKQAQQQDQVMLIFLNFKHTDWQCVALCFLYDRYDFFLKSFSVCVLKIANWVTSQWQEESAV